MAFPGDIDPFAPPVPGPGLGDLRPAWEQWLAAQVAAVEPPPEPMIEMPADPVTVAAQADQVIEMPADPASVPAAAEMQAIEMPPDNPWAMQPGLGVPQATVDAVVAAPPVETVGAPGVIPGSQFLGPIAEAAREKTTGGYAEPMDPNAPMADPAQREQHRVDGLSDFEIMREQRASDLERDRIAADAGLRAVEVERESAANAERAYADSQAQAAAKRAEIEADAARLSDDPEADWYEEGGIARSVFGGIAVALGGLTRNLNGGRNYAMESLDKAVDRYIVERRQKLAGKRQDLVDLKADAQDEFQMATTFRVATYERAIREINAQKAAYDQQGTAYRDLEMFERDLAAKQQQALQAAQDKAQKDSWERWKQQVELEGKLLDNRGKELDNAKKLSKLGGGGPAKVKPEDVVYPPEFYAGQGLAAPPTPMSRKDYAAWQKLKKGSQEITTNDNTSGMSREQLERKIPLGNGTSFIALGTPEAAGKVRAMVSGTQNAVRLIDDALRVRTGWSSDVGSSEEKKKLDAIWGQAKLAAKDTYALGAITASDVDLIKGALGTDDPSQWRDPTAGMLEARRLLVNRLNTELVGAGYEGPRYDIAAPPTKKPRESADDAALKQGQGEGSITDMADTAVGKNREVFKSIERWAVKMNGDGPEAAEARQYLANLATNGATAEIKQAAMSALVQQPLSETTGPTTSVARDTVAEPPPKKGKR
jgi:murein DD-endopeptidase MepM/ murein hydrolase activator NlpD